MRIWKPIEIGKYVLSVTKRMWQDTKIENARKTIELYMWKASNDIILYKRNYEWRNLPNLTNLT